MNVDFWYEACIEIPQDHYPLEYKLRPNENRLSKTNPIPPS